MQQIVVDTESRRQGGHWIFEAHRAGGPGHLPAPQRHLPPLPAGVRSGQLPGLCGGGLPAGPLRDRYRGIVENLLGRTVIVEELDSAIAMARQYRSRFKIVTLDARS